MTKDYALYLLNKLCIGASVEAMSIIPQFELAQALSVAIKALEQTKWIPCTERLPEKDGCYLVTYKWKGSYSGDTYVETTLAVYREKPKEWDCKDVIAWMPLPEPYKAESEDKE